MSAGIVACAFDRRAPAPFIALVVRKENQEEFCRLRDRLRELVLQDIQPHWEFAHRLPVSLHFNGLLIVTADQI